MERGNVERLTGERGAKRWVGVYHTVDAGSGVVKVYMKPPLTGWFALTRRNSAIELYFYQVTGAHLLIRHPGWGYQDSV